MSECYNSECGMPARGEGTGVFACEHEHMATEAQFCVTCWIIRESARFTWYCSPCYGRKPEGGREKWGHLCPMTLVLPSERMSA